MPVLTLILLINWWEQNTNDPIQFEIVACTTDEDCLAKNPHIEPY